MGIKFRNAKFVKDASFPDGPLLPSLPHKPTGLYLLELRNHTARRKLDVQIDPKTGEDGTPKRIRIKLNLRRAA
jgi:hypothetical protein